MQRGCAFCQESVYSGLVVSVAVTAKFAVYVDFELFRRQCKQVLTPEHHQYFAWQLLRG